MELIKGDMLFVDTPSDESLCFTFKNEVFMIGEKVRLYTKKRAYEGKVTNITTKDNSIIIKLIWIENTPFIITGIEKIEKIKEEKEEDNMNVTVHTTGKNYIQVKPVSLEGMTLNCLGKRFTVGEYNSAPHGFVPIRVEDEISSSLLCLLYISHDLFEESFIDEDTYNSYYGIGSIMGLRITDENGQLIQTGNYRIEKIEKDCLTVNLRLKKFVRQNKKETKCD